MQIFSGAGSAHIRIENCQSHDRNVESWGCVSGNLEPDDHPGDPVASVDGSRNRLFFRA